LKKHIKICDGTNNQKSGGEKRIEEVLKTLNIDYEYNQSYIVKSVYFLRWDFILNINGVKSFIEFNGRQHYKPVCFGGISLGRAKENFIRQQENDKIKNDFCITNNLKILWIHYKDFDSIDKLVEQFLNF